MKPHYSEADLLETYYTQPGESMPVMMHLAGCSDCAARYERLEGKLRGLAACEHDKPETFWARQRISVMRRIDKQRDRSSHVSRAGRVAAAAMLVALLGGGLFTWQESTKQTPAQIQQPVQTATLEASEPLALDASEPADPWASDELNDFHSVVAWESWVDSSKGDQSL